MQINVKDGYITGYAIVGGFADGIDESEELITSLEIEKLGYYKYDMNKPGNKVFDSEKFKLDAEKKEKAAQAEKIRGQIDELQEYLNKTDRKISQRIREMYLIENNVNLKPTLTDEEYLELEEKRQDAVQEIRELRKSLP